jgi:hypothetical protein
MKILRRKIIKIEVSILTFSSLFEFVNIQRWSLKINLDKKPLSYAFKKYKSVTDHPDGRVSEDTVGDILRDGDEFVFKLTSFDKWIQMIINFKLKNHSHLKFTTKCEMRVCGYFPNSHFFNIIERKAIDDWNANIFAERGKKDYYVMKDISFINSKIYLERVDSHSKAPELINFTKPRITELYGMGNNF